MTVGRAAGKVILFGEHAVVYGRPAVAVPVTQVQAQAEIEDGALGQGITIVAEDLDRVYSLSEAPPDDALKAIVISTLEHMGVGPEHDLIITVRSTIPMARGLGSGAAVSTAIVRALGRHFERWMSSRAVSDLVYETEVLYHGTPSGIDNTVIAFEKPVYFVKGRKMEIFWVRHPFLLVIADTGVSSPTKVAVGDVRRAWEKEPQKYNRLFDQMGALAQAGREAIESGKREEIGRLMDENQSLLRAIDVSSSQLEALIEAARESGALGAKLSGAGRGGNMIALVTSETYDQVRAALRRAGARNVIVTEVR
jgi:mevalonate kinase